MVGTGDIRVCYDVDGSPKIAIIKRVLHIPNLHRNLFSIRQVASFGILTIFDEDSVEMLDKRQGRIKVLEGSLDGKMYKLHLVVILRPVQALSVVSIRQNSSVKYL